MTGWVRWLRTVLTRANVNIVRGLARAINALASNPTEREKLVALLQKGLGDDSYLTAQEWATVGRMLRVFKAR